MCPWACPTRSGFRSMLLFYVSCIMLFVLLAVVGSPGCPSLLDVCSFALRTSSSRPARCKLHSHLHSALARHPLPAREFELTCNANICDNIRTSIPCPPTLNCEVASPLPCAVELYDRTHGVSRSLTLLHAVGSCNIDGAINRQQQLPK